jgi:peptidoglycan/LPS O-acetylase OafA/YrhL
MDLKLNHLIARFSRQTSTGMFIPEIDGLRFIAIALVVMFHLSGFVAVRSPAAFTPAIYDHDWTFRVFRHGDGGVRLFFIISGFVLALPFARHFRGDAPPVKLSSYFLRRLTRLEPPYVISLLLLFAVLVLVKGHSAAALLPHLAASTLYVHNVVYNEASAINYVAWSLEIEVQFYIFAPLIGQLYRVRNTVGRRAIIIAASVAAAVLQMTVLAPNTRLAFTLLSFVQFFLMGFLLADIYLETWKGRPPVQRGWDVASLIGWPVLFLVLESGTLVPVLFPLLGLVLMIAAFRGNIGRRFIANRWIATIGGMCYSIYLLHYQLTAVVGALTTRLVISKLFWPNLLLQVILAVPVVLLASAVFFAAVERPCMDKHWPQKLARVIRRRFSNEVLVQPQD